MEYDNCTLKKVGMTYPWKFKGVECPENGAEAMLLDLSGMNKQHEQLLVLCKIYAQAWVSGR